MKRIVLLILAAGAASLGPGMGPSFLLAQTTPDLKRQDVWTEKDKKEFLKLLKSGPALPVEGEVKAVAAPAGGAVKARKARYITLGGFSDTVLTVAADEKVNTEATSAGPKLLVGGHIFSWVRYYAGAGYTRVKQAKLDGTRASLDHFRVPVGVELALIPLGTPHTRYVILRGGLSAHRFSSGADKSEFGTSLLGWHGSYDIALGYEWQFADTNFRVHALAEGYRSILKSGSPKFYGVGLAGGVVYTF